MGLAQSPPIPPPPPPVRPSRLPSSAVVAWPQTPGVPHDERQQKSACVWSFVPVHHQRLRLRTVPTLPVLRGHPSPVRGGGEGGGTE